MFIKLTAHEDGTSALINLSQIVSVEEIIDDGLFQYSRVSFTDEHSLDVKENVKAIIREINIGQIDKIN
jgi:hypothetical protein